jgi:thiol-disulfide isomerase/thioredoxin
MKLITHLLLLLFACVFAEGQSIASSPRNFKNGNPIEIDKGEKVPDLTLKPLGQTEFKLSDLRGKLVIIDFFGVNCSACIKALPEMQQLQDSLSNEIQILVVTKDDSSSMRKLFSRISILKNIHLPIITNDSALSSFFYYASLPTHVWIDTNGFVIQKTAGYNTSMKKIAAWLSGEKIELPEKNELADYEFGVPLFVEGGGRQLPHMRYYSLIMGVPYGMGSGQPDFHIERDSSTGKIFRILKSRDVLLDLYRYAYMEDDKRKRFLFEPGRVKLNVKIPEMFDFPDDKEKMDEWSKENLFSYEIKVPIDKSDSIFNWMQQDLNRYFGYSAEIKKEKVKCWILKSVEKSDGAVAMQNPNSFAKTDSLDHTASVPFQFFVESLKYVSPLRKAPVINEVHDVKMISIDLNWGLDDLDNVKKILSQYNVRLDQEERELDILVIKD